MLYNLLISLWAWRDVEVTFCASSARDSQPLLDLPLVTSSMRNASTKPIARALSLHPEVLLMDEPFSSLDELTAKTLRSLVLNIWRDPTLPTNTFLMVSHNVEEAVFMADRVVVMSPRPGKIVGEVKIDIPRPRVRYLRDSIYFNCIDDVLVLLEKGNAKFHQ